MRVFRNLFWMSVILITLAVNVFAVADLPRINENELIELIRYSESTISDISVRYIVEETFSRPMKTVMTDNPQNDARFAYKFRKLTVEWRKKDNKYFYDLASLRDNELLKPFDFMEGYNGQACKQLFAGSNTGNIINRPIKHAWPIPTDFGLMLGQRDKPLGTALSECEIKKLTSSQRDGHECYYVEAVKSNGANVRLWIDPEVGYRARHIEVDRIKGGINFEVSAEFKEYDNGIWFPISGLFNLYRSDESGKRIVSTERRLKVESVKLNSNLQKEDFEIEFPLGTIVTDQIYGISYTIGAPRFANAVLDDIVTAVKKEEKSSNTDKSTKTTSLKTTSRLPVAEKIANQVDTKISHKIQPAVSADIGNKFCLLPWVFGIVIILTLCLVTVVCVRRRRKACNSLC